MKLIYDSRFATFMERLTGKEPGMWASDFIEACKWFGDVDPQELIDAMDDFRRNGSSPER